MADSQNGQSMGAPVCAEGSTAARKLAPRQTEKESVSGESVSFIGLHSLCSEPNPQVTVENYKLFILVDVRKGAAIS